MITQNRLRVASLLLALVAGSCSSASSDDQPQQPAFEDGAANHPITSEPSYRTLKLANTIQLSNSDVVDLATFVDDYMTRGAGAISISVPAGPNSAQVITSLGEHIAELGVPRARILVGVQDQGGPDARVEIGFITYEARLEPCGDWSVNAADTSENLPMPNFGCSVQHNIAAEIADPRDIDQSRGLGPADAERRMQVLGKYEQAQTTSAQKTQDQSGAVSDVGSQ
jgi:pilus assembly protein CpaD